MQTSFGGADFAQTQWRAESLQLVNWGGFDGAHRIEFSPETTLLSGASGTGKSTILDAYLALMMDSNTPFNGASNDAVRGRVRGATQRSLLTYLRGKLDDLRTDGESTERVLRGANTATWGGIAVTFRNDIGAQYTVGRLYYVPRSAARDSDVAKRLWSITGSIDLKEFEPIAVDKFEKKAVRSRYPHIEQHDTYEAFAAMLQTRLGIGEHGDPSSALRLLARIQAGRPVAAVDDLFKQMVLETPSTFAAADSAIEHFADLEAAYSEMVEAAEQEQILEPIVDHWRIHSGAEEEIARIDAYGSKTPQSSFAHWADRYEQAMINDAQQRNRGRRADDEATAQAAQKEQADFAALVAAYTEAIAAAGGLELTKLDEVIDELRTARRDALNARDRFDERTAMLALANATGDEFNDSRQAARLFVDEAYERAEAKLGDETGVIQKRVALLEHEIGELSEDRDSLRGRTGQIPRQLHEQRVEAARAAGLNPADLPFVAELIDVPVEHNAWRTAAEVVFGPVARIMLVDERHRDGLSRAIDELRWARRIQFQGIDPEPFVATQMDGSMLSGKLVYQDSPFAAWIRRRLTDQATDALCVDSVEQLSGAGQRVTRSGQVRHGRRGAHGGVGAPIIGFDNAERLADIERRLAGLAEHQRDAEGALRDIQQRRTELTALLLAHRFVLDTDWVEIDHESIQARIDRAEQRKAEILDANGELEQLEKERAAAEAEQLAAASRYHGAINRMDQLDTEHDRLVARHEEVDAGANALERAGCAATDDQATFLTERFSSVADASGYDAGQFAAGLGRLVEALDKDRAAATARSKGAVNSLEMIFERFDEKWPNPNLGTSVESYPDYLQIREQITASGLHERRETWIRKLAEWTGEDLVPLNGEFDNAIDDIEARLHPVNVILSTLDFGAHHDRLRIDLRKLNQDRQTTFRRELRELSSGATGELNLDQAKRKFVRLQNFMALIHTADEKSRNYHLDVRKHIELSAAVVAADGTIRAQYTSLGEKSGGETQELVAFIVGSALRFQLGDETKTRPRFAPVLLDEGFVKADAEFAGRGVRAWQGLGFQLMIAVPLDKVTALEPHVDKILLVTKNPGTGQARLDDITGENGPTVEGS